MGVNLTQDQLEQLIQALRPAAASPMVEAGAAAIVGRLSPCELGRDKMKRYKKFLDWVADAESKMRLLNITDSQQKVSFVQSSAGVELTTFGDKEARVRWVATQNPAQAAHSYEEVITLSKTTFLKYVSRDRAIIDLLHMPQGDKSVTEFVAQVEDQATLCRVGEVAITEDDLKRLALIAGFKDRTLAEKCLGEEYDLRQVIATAVTRESSKANAEAVKVQESTVGKQGTQEDGGWQEQLQRIQGDVKKVMKLQQKGKYSGQAKKTCSKCTFEHERDGKCPAVGRECRRCGQEGHFSRSSLCKGRPKSTSTRRVEEADLPSDYEEGNYSSGEETVARVEESSNRSTMWPGVRKDSKTSHVRKVDTKVINWPGVRRGSKTSIVRKVNTGGDRWVELQIGRTRMRLYADTGSKYTIITPKQYKRSMGEGSGGRYNAEGVGVQVPPGREGDVPHHSHHGQRGYHGHLGLCGGRVQARGSAGGPRRGGAGHLHLPQRGKGGDTGQSVGLRPEEWGDQSQHWQEGRSSGHHEGEGAHHGCGGQVQRHSYL